MRFSVNKNELKQMLAALIDSQSAEIIASGEKLLRMPELSYKETQTSAYVTAHFEKLGLPLQKNLAITGVRAECDTGRPGPKVGILGELDGLIVPNHTFADPDTHAAHACGHHAALNAMLFAATFLTRPEVKEHLSGSFAFVGTPAEECQDQPFIASLIKEGKLEFFGGKSQLIAEGVFDDIDIAMMLHAGDRNFTPSGFNGFVMKRLVFKGKSAHAGAYPERGVNAISMMRCAMAMIDAQRDTFRDEDHVRIHGYIPEGGEAVNVVPDNTVFTLQVRAGSPEAIADASQKVDRCVHAAALAFGGEAAVENLFGFMPLIPYSDFDDLHIENAKMIAPEATFTRGIYRSSSTDMGDVSMIRPSLHAYFRGFEGTAHTDTFLVKDSCAAYVDAVKFLVFNAVDLLWDDASAARRIAALPTPMTKEGYISAMRRFSAVQSYSYKR